MKVVVTGATGNVSRDAVTLERINIEGSRRVFEAVAAASVPKLVHASSVGAYSRGPKDREVDESWPTEGTPTSLGPSGHPAGTGVMNERTVEERFFASR